MATEFSDETLKSSISNGSSNASASSSPNSVTSKKQVIESNVTNGELFLLYRYLRNRKMYHGVNAKNGSTNRKKGVIIPQEFPGVY